MISLFQLLLLNLRLDNYCIQLIERDFMIDLQPFDVKGILGTIRVGVGMMVLVHEFSSLLLHFA